MSKRVSFLLLALAMLLLTSLAASAQQQPLPVTYVSEWTIPRAQWDEYVSFVKKNTQPILEKLDRKSVV